MPKKQDPPAEFDVSAATVEELGSHRADLVDALKALRPESKEALAAMSDEDRAALKTKRDEINTQIQAVEAERTARAEREAAAEAELAEFDEAVAALEPAEIDVEEEDEEPDPATAPVQEPDPATVPLAASVPAKPATKPATPAKPATKPLTASVPSPKDVRPPSGAKVIPLRREMAIVAAGGLNNFDIGQPLTEQQFGEAMLGRLMDVAGSTQAPRSIVASMPGAFPPERILGRDPVLNDIKLAEAAGQMMSMDGLRQALTAAMCAPGTPFYDLPNISTDDRPMFNGLNAFGAEVNRGKIIYQQPASITDFAPAVTTITDLCGSPTPATKNLMTLSCGVDVTVCLEAQVLRIRIDNFNQMTFPEKWEEAWLKARSALARVREGRTLQIIDDSPNTRTATRLSTQLGAARDLFDAWSVAAVVLRNHFRMSEFAPITVAAPQWAKDAIVMDLMKGMPGDSAWDRGRSYVDEIANRLGLNMIWYIDSPNGAGQINQLYGLQADGAALQDWIDTVVSYVFPPAVWNTLSGRTLDLGTDIRDTTTNALNMVEGFIEFFETTFFRGELGTSVRIQNKICVSGRATAGVTYLCPTGS